MTDSGNTVTLQQGGTSSNNGHPQTINSTLRICLNFKIMHVQICIEINKFLIGVGLW